MHFLVFDRAPQPLDENVVHETTAPVHRNRDTCGLEPASEGGAGELRALIGVEYLWRAVPRQRFVERRDAKAGMPGLTPDRGMSAPSCRSPPKKMTDLYPATRSPSRKSVGFE